MKKSDAGPVIAARPPKRWLTLALQLAMGCCVGLLSFLVIAPGPALRGGADGFVTHEDPMTYTASLRYFVWDDWRWPLTRAARLGSARGTAIALTDSIPIYGFALRCVRGWISPEFNFLGVWLALCCALQGAAAVAAVRMWGFRIWPVAIAAAAFAASMPAWLAQINLGHAALCLQAPLLLAVGLPGLRRTWLAPRLASCGLLLVWLTLAVSPYLFVMAAVLVVALIGQLAMDGWPRRRAAAFLGVLAAGAAGEAWSLGFFEPFGQGLGFSFFSMDLLSPIWPPPSSVLGRFGRTLDATGGQYEGFNYLGAGLLVLLAAVAWAEREGIRSRVRRWPWFVIAAVALTACALSNQVRAAGRLLLVLPPPPAALAQLRASGRFFWPVAYLLLAVALVLAARRGRRFKMVLLFAAFLQWFDAAGERERGRGILANRPPFALQKSAWVPLIEDHQRVVILPSAECIAKGESRLLGELIYLASVPRTEVSTVYWGRLLPADCVGQAREVQAIGTMDQGTLLVLFDSARLEAPRNVALGGSPWRCARFAGGRACSARAGALGLLRQIGEIG